MGQGTNIRDAREQMRREKHSVCSMVACGMPVKQHLGETYSTNCGIRTGGGLQPVAFHLKNQEIKTISSYSKVAEKDKSLIN